jgi:nitrous oxide reductase accessory protein NosL
MRKLFIHIVAVLLVGILGMVQSGWAGEVEPPAKCGICGMSRAVLDSSRMLIEFEDGTRIGACSINCAAEALKKEAGRKVSRIMVADYSGKNLIDARTAHWVVGGSKKGVMTDIPKWAFADEDRARQFIAKSGGKPATFDEVLNTIETETAGSAGSHHGHNHGPGAQLEFNPAFGDDIYHTHPAGMWMANYKYMHMAQRGLRNGTTNVPTENATPVGNTPFGFMMAPTSMTMDMHMVMVMYGLTDRLTLMGMGTWLDNKMEMVMNMGMGNMPDSPMKSSGLGDTELRGIYKICNTLSASLGLSIPTGDIDQDFSTMGMKFRLPYDMQLGSGTVDLKPALTWSVLSDDAKWNWGGQTGFTYHIDHNANSYSLGDSAKVTGWLQRAMGPASTWLRLSYNYAGRINGKDQEIDKLLDPVAGAPTPDADPANYGGHHIDGFAGVSYTAGPFAIGLEAGIPLYQNLNGLQLKNDWYLTVGVQAMF